jgi:hypothetical protein
MKGVAKPIFLPTLSPQPGDSPNLFTECPMAKEIWTRVSAWAGLQGFLPGQWQVESSMVDWYGNLVKHQTMDNSGLLGDSAGKKCKSF